MQLRLAIATMLLSGCAPPPWMLEPGLPADLARDDPGTITGAWKEVRRDGRQVRSGYNLSIGYPEPYTFAARKGCVVTGGVLAPLGGGGFRIERYEAGFETEGCGPWKSGPELAPFDGTEVQLIREGMTLTAIGGGQAVEFSRLRLR